MEHSRRDFDAEVLTRVKAWAAMILDDERMFADPPLFSDRAEAGRLLARKLAGCAGADVVVYALPRGGAPVAFEIAKALDAPLDLVLVRKIGAPGQRELALGAVVEGEPPHMVINADVRRMTGASDAYVEREAMAETAEIARRRKIYLGDRPRRDPKGKTCIVVDDGLATGATARAAVQGLRAQGAARVVLAAPVAPAETATALRAEVDELVLLAEPSFFRGVGAFYGDFHQLSDQEVLDLLADARAFGADEV